MGSPQPPDFSGFIARLTRALEEQALPFMLIGGQAVLLHGRPRLTEDIDVTLGVTPDRLPDVLAVSSVLELQPLPEQPEQFVRETFVLPVAHADTGIRVDFIFSTTAYEQQAIERAVRVAVGGTQVPFATAEDLIIHKLFAGRPQDWEDVVSVVRRKGDAIDWDYLERWVGEFAAVPGREDMTVSLTRLRDES